MKKRRPISRILSWVIIYLCGLPASRMKRVTSLPTNRDSSPIWPCTGRGLPCLQVLPPEAVGSYPTFSPLPPKGRFVFCGTFRRLTAPLAGVLPCGVRTFLPPSTVGRIGGDHLAASGVYSIFMLSGSTRMRPQVSQRIKSAIVEISINFWGGMAAKQPPQAPL